MTPGASWEHVTKLYGPRAALEDFSLELGPGVHALLGPNGAGKSTALNLLSGIRLADDGVMRVCGERVTRGGRSARSLSSTPQALSFPPVLRVREVLDFIAAHYPQPLAIDALCDRLPLAQLLERKCGGLSGGQTRVVGLACALSGNTEVLLLDEPSTGLDPETRSTVHEILREQRTMGRCIILSTHDYAEAETTADTVSLIRHGRLLLHERLGQLTRLRSESTKSGELTLEHLISDLLRDSPEAAG
ncbi:ABC transporter ATP-binding protein [Acaricomes phytoseiuli]|uniref:ABC transporter ATP-binding protein n=1 Tax=Acaricomes phytoseiuli TaxID=291968 RepID=UPI00036DD9B6|nr:ABC transporter ATP-binding protein [Acaricomes phytoseiuli]MCW1249738.1 ABC transporter ATP-binding protein [Acaricomes phytoseiuli]